MIRARNDRYFQGTYRLKNPQKYAGAQTPIFRSSYEAAFFDWCDTNPDVVKWGSEIFSIPYRSPLQNHEHKYIVDCYVECKNSSGNIDKFLVEIKPKSQTSRPQKPMTTNWRAQRNYRCALATYLKNVSKWKAAHAFCGARGMKFMILTEDDLHDMIR